MDRLSSCKEFDFDQELQEENNPVSEGNKSQMITKRDPFLIWQS